MQGIPFSTNSDFDKPCPLIIFATSPNFLTTPPVLKYCQMTITYLYNIHTAFF